MKTIMDQKPMDQSFTKGTHAVQLVAPSVLLQKAEPGICEKYRYPLNARK